MALKQVIPVIKTFFLGTNTQLKKLFMAVNFIATRLILLFCSVSTTKSRIRSVTYFSHIPV